MDWIATVALATLIVGLFAWLRADIAALRKALTAQGAELRGEISAQGNELRGEISILGKEVGKLRERMARMEGLLEGLREAVAGRQAA